MKRKVATASERIQEAMRSCGKRQADLAAETGIYKGTVSNYIKGRYEPKAPAIVKLAKALNCSEMWLAGFEDDPDPEQRKERKEVMKSNYLTDAEVEREIERLEQSELVKLARKEEQVRYARRQYLYKLRGYEKKGRELAKAGITVEMLCGIENQCDEPC